jgi:putative protease
MKINNTQKSELLCPASDFEKLKVVLRYGADAVYIGDKNFSLRANANNFTNEELEEAIKYCHNQNKKVYVTANIFARNNDFEGLSTYLKHLENINCDAIIVSDPGIINLVTELALKMPIFLSTQSNTTNFHSCKFWKKIGIKRIILARELSLMELKEIREKTNLELEVFIHGALCISYSGRCFISKYLVNRDANRGDCTNSCRWSYHLMEEKRHGEFFPVFEDKRGTYLYSSKDLMLINFIPQLIDLGIDSFKIEGRAKSTGYLACVVSIYRKVIDEYLEKREAFVMKQEWVNELLKVGMRPHMDGFISGNDIREMVVTENPKENNFLYAGLIIGSKNKLAKVLVKNRIQKADTIEIFNGSLPNQQFILSKILNEKGDDIDFANPNSVVFLNLKTDFKEFDILRKVKYGKN